MTLRVAVIGVPGAWSTERLRDALAARGADAMIVDPAACAVDLTEGTVTFEGVDLGTLDGVVVKKLGSTTDPLMPSRVQILHQLEHRGVRVFSRARAIADVNDRYRMTQRLGQSGIPIPRTVVAESIWAADLVIREWGRVVVKPLFTSKGRGMLLLHAGRPYRLALRRWQRAWRVPFYLQEFVPHAGRDIGAVVLNGHVLGAYYRIAGRGAWLTTTAAGGAYEACEVTPEMARLAVRAADVFGLEFTGVDLVETPGGYLVYEVSAFGGFAGLWRSQAIDAAQAYAEYVVHALTGSAQYGRTGLSSPHVSA
ncbi:MAG TPA: RimK family alpha-L-glutamate ligase [bacterium]|nr:RimK family alpha-L-glutamate ligase [bacterium]